MIALTAADGRVHYVQPFHVVSVRPHGRGSALSLTTSGMDGRELGLREDPAEVAHLVELAIANPANGCGCRWHQAERARRVEPPWSADPSGQSSP